MKKCASCENFSEYSEFLKDQRTKDKLGSWCRICRNAYKRTPRQLKLARKAKKNSRDRNYEHYRKVERRRELKKKYGMTLEDYEAMRISQNFKCAICEKHEQASYRQKLFIDHCHKTGKVRQLLCDKCNVGLGSFLDNEKFLEEAIQYLKRHRS